MTELANKGINVRVMQVLAHHKDISTTQQYIDYNEGKLRNAIELAYPMRPHIRRIKLWGCVSEFLFCV